MYSSSGCLVYRSTVYRQRPTRLVRILASVSVLLLSYRIGINAGNECELLSSTCTIVVSAVWFYALFAEYSTVQLVTFVQFLAVIINVGFCTALIIVGCGWRLILNTAAKLYYSWRARAVIAKSVHAGLSAVTWSSDGSTYTFNINTISIF